jgi:hypothetical protein
MYWRRAYRPEVRQGGPGNGVPTIRGCSAAEQRGEASTMTLTSAAAPDQGRPGPRQVLRSLRPVAATAPAGYGELSPEVIACLIAAKSPTPPRSKRYGACAMAALRPSGSSMCM